MENAAAKYGRNIWEESHKQCLDEKRAQGLSIDDAMEACGAHTLPLVDYFGKKVEKFELVNAALTTVGASDGSCSRVMHGVSLVRGDCRF